ncbi:MAG: glycosyltransferase family 4 protein [Actinobacteria bacterium]|nr:glycosyltransferase family 4 protein [Actinomycetota bacterium]
MRSISALRIAVDGTPLLGNRTGVGEVAAGLLRALAARPDVEPIAYALTWRGRGGLAPVLPRGVRGATRPAPARVVRGLWERGSVEPRVERWTGPVDVVHALNYVAPPARAPVMVMVHDLTFVRYPELCTPDTLRYPLLLRRAVDRGATVHTPSRFVADEVAEHFGLAPDRIVAVHSGVPDVGAGDRAGGARLAGAERYVLALGTVEPRKNLPALVRAFGLVARADPDVVLVVAGPDGWDRERFTAAVDISPARERIVRLGYVRDAARRDLLAGASVFAYPSIYEGFGFPALEAMAAGVPVVAGRAGALPEVLGDAALFVDPHDDDAIAAALLDALHADTTRQRLVASGLARTRRYTWERMAATLVERYPVLR